MARPKRSFANITQLPSKRWQVKYTGPDGIRRYAPHTFDTRLTAEAFVVATRRKIDRDQWNATDDNPKEAITFGVYAARWLANRQVAGRPIKARTREHYSAILDDHLLPTFGHRQLAAIKPKDVRAWYEAALVDRPTMRSHAYSLLRTIMASAVNDEILDGNPARIVGAGRSKRVHKIRPASIEELAVLTEAMPERLRLMVTLASWCALRFGEIVELRRGDVDLSADLIRIRRAAVRTKGAYSITTPKSDAGIRDVDVPPHCVPLIEAHLAKHVGKGRDSLIFPADHGGHLQPSTLYRHWYRARDLAGRPDLRFHDCRHSGAVLAAATGASLAELLERLGHSTPAAVGWGKDGQARELLPDGTVLPPFVRRTKAQQLAEPFWDRRESWSPICRAKTPAGRRCGQEGGRWKPDDLDEVFSQLNQRDITGVSMRALDLIKHSGIRSI